MRHGKRVYLFILIISFLYGLGCSGGGGGNPTIPDAIDGKSVDASDASRANWGMWQFVCDPAAGSVEIVPLRDTELHLNALNFLEPPANVYLTLESPPSFSGTVLDVDIGLRHPFLGLQEYTGFDVCGVVISHGSVSGFTSDPGLKMPGEGDVRLLNADGHTRWWNPDEFPPDLVLPVMGYKDGLFGAQDSAAEFDATLNGYKYYTDGLDPNDPVTSIDLDSRGMFSAGQKNIRHYTIEMDTSYLFNYAIDANWARPVGDPPFEVPGDFPEKANRPEAWNISITEVENTLGYENSIGGGHLLMHIDVYDWFNAEMNEVTVESLAGIDPVTTSTPIGGGEGYSTYELDLPGDGLTQAGDTDLLITVRSEKTGYQGMLPGEYISAYRIHTTEVEDFIPHQSVWEWVFDDEQQLIDSIHMDRTPAIHQRTTYDVDIGYTRLEGIPNPPDDNSRANCHMLSSVDNGETFDYIWYGNATHFGQTLKSLKACQGPLGNTVFMYQSWLDWGVTPGTHASTARNPACPFGENIGIYLPWGAHANEVIWGADDIVLVFGDRDSEIAYKKGSHPFSLFYNGSWTEWINVPETVIVPNPAQLGVTRCMVKDSSGAIHFAYFGGEGGVWIKMMSNSDGLGTNWDSDVYINEGFTDEYASRIEPSLAIGPGGEFHSTFVGEIDPTYAILYTQSADGDSWPGYNPIYTNTDAWLGEVTVDAFQQDVDTNVVIISFEMEGDIWFISSLDGGLTFSEPVLISDGTGNSTEPDILADEQGYVHIAWSEFKEVLPIVDDYDIHYRRAYLVPQG